MKKINNGFSVVELLMVIAIILLLAAPFVRLKYGRQVRNWEQQKVERLGLPLPVHYAILTPIAISVLVWRVKQLSQKKPSNSMSK